MSERLGAGDEEVKEVIQVAALVERGHSKCECLEAGTRLRVEAGCVCWGTGGCEFAEGGRGQRRGSFKSSRVCGRASLGGLEPEDDVT